MKSRDFEIENIYRLIYNGKIRHIIQKIQDNEKLSYLSKV